MGTTPSGEGQQLLHQIECIQPNAAPIGSETPSLASSGLLDGAKQCATVWTEIGKDFADCEHAGTARALTGMHYRTFLRPVAPGAAQEELL